MSEIWRLTATLLSGLLLISEEHELNLLGKPGDKTRIHFAKPESVENSTWTSWDHGIPYPMWIYKVTFEFESETEDEAVAKAWNKLDKVAARLSFLGSAPVMIKSHGNLTNSPDVPDKDREYTLVARTAETAWEGREPPLFNEAEMRKAINVIISDDLVEDGTERIDRSMMWLQHSYFAFTPIDEFTSLMLAFEAISHLLKSSKPKYWKCRACEMEMKECPYCGESTEWEGSGNLAMEEFVREKLGWSSTKWKKLWKIRNSLFHARHDLSLDEQARIVAHLPELEEAVINALRYILRLSSAAPPKTGRQRSMFSTHNASLRVKWKPGEPSQGQR